MCSNKKWLLYIIPACLGSLAFCTSSIFSFWCESFKFTPISGDNGALPAIYAGPWYQRDVVVESVSIGGGYTTVNVREVCIDYPSGSKIDSKWKAVRAFSIIALVLGGLGLIPLWFNPCLFYLSTSSWKSLAIMYAVVITLFQGLTFLIFRSNACKDSPLLYSLGLTTQVLYPQDCEWGEGSTSNVIATVLWFLTGVSMMAVGAPVRPERAPAETQTVTYEQTRLPDGTTTVAETAIIKGTAVDPAFASHPLDSNVEVEMDNPTKYNDA